MSNGRELDILYCFVIFLLTRGYARKWEMGRMLVLKKMVGGGKWNLKNGGRWEVGPKTGVRWDVCHNSLLIQDMEVDITELL